MGEGLQARPCNAGGSAVRGGSGLEALTHWPAAINRRDEQFKLCQISETTHYSAASKI